MFTCAWELCFESINSKDKQTFQHENYDNKYLPQRSELSYCEDFRIVNEIFHFTFCYYNAFIRQK